jgi:DNA polymerase III alpha subunit
MLSIGEFAKAANVSNRTLRHYEGLGLIAPIIRGENNYRYYVESQIESINRIRDLQRLGFSLEEVREVLSIGSIPMTSQLEKRLKAVEDEIQKLANSRDRIVQLLSISQRVEAAQAIGLNERRIFMDAVKELVLSGLKSKNGTVNSQHLQFLEREKSLYDSEEKREFIDAVRRCIEFAADKGLTLGPGRGSCPASIVLYGLGFSGIDPTKYDLIPERLATVPPDIHIDVEYEHGQIFVDFCRRTSENLRWGQINAFRMPLIDIINRVHSRIGCAIDYAAISDDSPEVLDIFRRGDIEKIFLFDYSPTALIMKFENTLPDFVGTKRIKEYLTSQPIYSFRDIINIIALWRPNCSGNIERIERYRKAKSDPVHYGFLSPVLRTMLEPNFGLIIYQEDLIQIIADYTQWDLERCSRLRRDLFLGIPNDDIDQLRQSAPGPVFDLVMAEVPYAFCKPHAVSFGQFTKKTAVLKSQFPDAYLSEVETWEQQHGLKYDDIGVRLKGVSLLQH